MSTTETTKMSAILPFIIGEAREVASIYLNTIVVGSGPVAAPSAEWVDAQWDATRAILNLSADAVEFFAIDFPMLVEEYFWHCVREIRGELAAG